MAVYGGLSLKEMVSRVAMTVFDAYKERLPGPLVKKWVREGAVHVDMRVNWSRDEYTVPGDSVAGQYAYDLPSYTRFITAVTFADAPLGRIEHEEWLKAYNDDSDSDTPTAFAQWSGAIWLYPLPGDGNVIKVYMVRAPEDLALDTDIPELPIELHDTITRYALAQAYWHLQDIQAAQSYEGRVEADLVRFKGEIAEYRTGRDHMIDVDSV